MKHRIHKLTLLALIAQPGFAQGSMVTPGSEKEGSDESIALGWSRDNTHRLMVNTHANGKARAIKRISFRLDGKEQNAFARSWSKVTIDVAHGVWSSINSSRSRSADFKLKDSRVRVFDQKWSFPAFKGKPLLSPASWGGPLNSLSFTFTKAFQYNGKDALFIEFKFSGGTSSATQKWEPAWVPPSSFIYRLDTLSYEEWGSKGSGKSLPEKPAPCYDAGWSRKEPVVFDVLLYGDKTIKLSISSSYTSKTSPVLYLLGTSTNPRGLDVFADCNLFYLDLLQPLIVLILPAPNNARAHAETTIVAVKQPWMKDFWAQAAWLETTSNKLKLTEARSVSVSTSSQAIAQAASSLSNGRNGFQAWFISPKYVPMMRFDYQ